jgi:hypothetical protein
MGLPIDIRNCACCSETHQNVELFAGPVAAQFPVWGNLSRNNLWYLCPVFLRAVVIPVAALGE